MSNLLDTIDNLRDQVSDLEREIDNLREANQEWSELADNYDADHIKDVMDLHDSENIDVDELRDALRKANLDQLVDAYDEVEEWGSPEELADKVEDLEEELKDAQRESESFEEKLEELTESGVSADDHDSLRVELAAVRADYENARKNEAYLGDTIIALKAERDEWKKVAGANEQTATQAQYELDVANRKLDDASRTTPYKALYDALVAERGKATVNANDYDRAVKNLLAADREVVRLSNRVSELTQERRQFANAYYKLWLQYFDNVSGDWEAS